MKLFYIVLPRLSLSLSLSLFDSNIYAVSAFVFLHLRIFFQFCRTGKWKSYNLYVPGITLSMHRKINFRYRHVYIKTIINKIEKLFIQTLFTVVCKKTWNNSATQSFYTFSISLSIYFALNVGLY
jgi:hypothetical protein